MQPYTYRNGAWVGVMAKHDKGDICQVIGCRTAKRHSKNGGGRLFVSRICDRCRTNLFRLNHPIRYVLQRLRRRAMAKRVPFSLTAEYMAEFLSGTGYLEGKGVGCDDLQIDRIEIHLGYTPGNLQILTGRENRKKQHEYDYEGCREQAA